jgi:molybdate transport system substrate-binding protein
MRRRLVVSALAVCALAATATAHLPAVGAVRVPASGGLLVSAAASLTEAMTEIAQRYERGTGVRPVLNFGASSSLARQIVNGAPVDVFVSADEAQMDVLAAAGRIDPASRVDLLRNQLVVIVPAGGQPLASARDLIVAAFRHVAMADPTAVPAGVYARRYLESLGLWTAIEPKVVPTLDVRAALAAVDSGNADAAFVYRTDAATARRSTLAFAVPIAEGPRIVYPAAVMASASHGSAARTFLAYLRGSEARAVFTRFGFLPATDAR